METEKKKWTAKWIRPVRDFGDAAAEFLKDFSVDGKVKKALLFVTAQGVYEARLNGRRIGNFVLAPGFTSYAHRLQYQTYDVTDMLQQDNHMEILLGKGWYRSNLLWYPVQKMVSRKASAGILLELEITYDDGRVQTIASDESFLARESKVRFSEIYDGEIYDALFEAEKEEPVEAYEGPWDTLISQEGEDVTEHERIGVMRIFTTPAGEVVVDFGQEIAGYVEISLEAKKGETVDLSFAEVMDQKGNFYNKNYRFAKCWYRYTCGDGAQSYKPKLTFYGFRYVRVNAFPGGPDKARPENFTAIAVHSNMRRTGYLSSSDGMLNRLIDNIVWGQKGNFLDVPTDCPQRDERMGWTGDAQVFSRTGCLNFDAEKFYTKWLGDLAADQFEDGNVGRMVPNLLGYMLPSAAWGDAATICPWEVYLAYGSREILERQFDSMKKWVDYITSATKDEGLWTGGAHYGDWLGLDAPVGSYKGSSREEFVATAFYAHSASLVVKAGRAIGRDMSAYEKLYEKIREKFRETYTDYRTQTECVLAAHFKLAPCPQKAADQLAQMIEANGTSLTTGFVGAPYLLHVLSDYGYASLAYSLLLRKEYPSWLYPVTKGATTMWEHWDNIMENGEFWSSDMNSFNHYAYGSVADWMYSTAAGIRSMEEAPGYEKVAIMPIPDARLQWFCASLETRHGLITSKWTREEKAFRYEITTPVEAQITIAGVTRTCPAGSYLFYSPIV